MIVVRDLTDLRDRLGDWRAQGLTIGLVPTMGALHAGHLSLIDILRKRTDRVVVSIFLNPKQFDSDADLERYPRDLDSDVAQLAGQGTDLVYAPSAEEMYPQGFATTVSVAGLTDSLEGAHRQGHFIGVATVVAKLLIQCQPDAALFGEKDYQQLAVLSRLVADLDLPVEIVPGPIVREADGLALSSRNAYLSAEERQIAPKLYETLIDLAARAEAGEALAGLEAEGAATLLAAGFDHVDYLEFRDADSLEPVATLNQPTRLLAVARLGETRLLDNLPVG
ncbi:MAG: pantoate--beta-alanine ligase [Sphingomonadales bacterium]|nr:pantoate--beta-alanine ligase [Sphingomonadales bacterium]